MIISQVRKHYNAFKLSWKFIAKALCFVVFLYFATLIVNHLKIAQYFPIKEVKVVGAVHLNHDEVQRLLSPLVHKDFFTVNLSLIKEQLLQCPWVTEVVVRRIWPDQVFIQLVEKTPVARWNNVSLLSTAGELFNPAVDTYPTKVPQFIGQEGQHLQMLKDYRQVSALLSPLHLKVVRFEIAEDGSWIFIFDNNIKLNVGYKDSLTHIDHFVKVYRKIIADRASDVDYIDLRYNNGLVVHWKTG